MDRDTQKSDINRVSGKPETPGSHYAAVHSISFVNRTSESTEIEPYRALLSYLEVELPSNLEIYLIASEQTSQVLSPILMLILGPEGVDVSRETLLARAAHCQKYIGSAFR